MEKHSVNINIFGRQFPATVDDEEKAVMEEAVGTINAKIKAFKAEYRTQDDLNVAIMCCLDIMTEYLTFKQQEAQQIQGLQQALNTLEQKLEETLQLAETT